MKTEQEQIEKMARSMCGYCSTDGRCAVSKNGREPDICANVDTQHCLYKEYAERLIESGYGKVSEYEAEIERLKAENEKRLKANEDFASKHCCMRCDIAKTLAKQAQIDVLNELRERITKDRVANDTVVINANYEIGELIKEIKNEQKD